MKKSNWKEEYDKYVNGEYDAKFEELEGKITDRKANKDEVKEYNKMKKVKENLKKIKNVLKYKKDLKKKYDEINEEIGARQELIIKSNKLQNLENGISKLMEESERITKELKNKNLDKAKRIQLEKQLENVRLKIDKNNADYKETTDFLQEQIGKRKFSELSSEELFDEREKIPALLTKCDIVCENLFNGLSWDSIDKKLDEFDGKRTYTSKDGKLGEKVDRAREERAAEGETAERSEDGEPEERAEGEEPAGMAEGEEPEEEMDDQEEEPSFMEKHPRLAKAINFFAGLGRAAKTVFNKIFRRGKDAVEELDPLPPEEDLVEGEPREAEEAVEEVVEEKSFKEMIREIAEKEDEPTGLTEALRQQAEISAKKRAEAEAELMAGREPGDD